MMQGREGGLGGKHLANQLLRRELAEISPSLRTPDQQTSLDRLILSSDTDDAAVVKWRQAKADGVRINCSQIYANVLRKVLGV